MSVSKRSQTITWGGVSNKTTTDPDFAVTATASSGLSTTITVRSGPATVSGSTVHLTGVAGTVVLRAVQAGSAAYLSTYKDVKFVVSNAVFITPVQTVPEHSTEKDQVMDLPQEANSKEHVQVEIYPNPSSGNIFINSSHPVVVTSVVSAIGQMVAVDSYSVQDNHLDLSGLPKGIYFIRFKVVETGGQLVKAIVLE